MAKSKKTYLFPFISLSTTSFKESAGSTIMTFPLSPVLTLDPLRDASSRELVAIAVASRPSNGTIYGSRDSGDLAASCSKTGHLPGTSVPYIIKLISLFANPIIKSGVKLHGGLNCTEAPLLNGQPSQALLGFDADINTFFVSQFNICTPKYTLSLDL